MGFQVKPSNLDLLHKRVSLRITRLALLSLSAPNFAGLIVNHRRSNPKGSSKNNEKDRKTLCHIDSLGKVIQVACQTQTMYISCSLRPLYF